MPALWGVSVTSPIQLGASENKSKEILVPLWVCPPHTSNLPRPLSQRRAKHAKHPFNIPAPKYQEKRSRVLTVREECQISLLIHDRASNGPGTPLHSTRTWHPSTNYLAHLSASYPYNTREYEAAAVGCPSKTPAPVPSNPDC